MSEIIIDNILNIKASTDKFHDELGTLKYLKFGIHSLAGNTRAIELQINNDPLFKDLSFSFGTHIGGALDIGKTAIVACFYHWYTNSIYNYIRLIRYIDGVNKGIEVIIKPTQKTLKQRREFYNEYISNVIPDIFIWRNKVTAHFAKTDPKESDGLATLEASVMYPVQYLKPYLRVGAMTWHNKGEESSLPEWSLTKSFEDLAERYWAELKIPTIGPTV